MKRWKTWLGIAISIAAIWYAMRGVRWGLVWKALENADYRLLLLVLVLAPVVNVGMRAVRWRILVLPVARVTVFSAAVATSIGLMANNVLPARIGEFVRAYSLARREEHRIPTGTAFASLFLERMFDGFALVGILYALAAIHVFPTWAEATARVAFWIFVGLLGFEILMLVRPRAVIRTFQWVSRRFFGGRFEDSIERAMVTFMDGFHLLKRPDLVVLSLLLAFAQWGLIAGLYLLGMMAFHLGEGWTAALFTTSITSLGVAVPSSPGFVGTFQALIVKSLEAFDVDRTTAFTYSVGFQAANYISVTAVGLVAFFREGLSWRELEESEEELERELEREYETEIGPAVEGDAEA